MKTFAIVYQCGIANVFEVWAKGRRRRVWQGAFTECEQWMRGAVGAG